MIFRQTGAQWLMLATVVVATLLLRALGLDRVLTSDEPLGLTRSANCKDLVAC